MSPTRIFGFAGWSGSGKTTLIEQLIPRFVARGLKVSVIKHAHHGFDIDRPGKDSWRHREAGAAEVMIVSAQRWVLMHELRSEQEPDLREQLAQFSPCDLVLVEGYKQADIPKLEVHRASLGKPLLQPGDSNIVALAADAQIDCPVPRFDLDEPDSIAGFIIDYLDERHESRFAAIR